VTTTSSGATSSILQPLLESDVDGTAVGLPDQVVLFRFAYLWAIAPQKVNLFTPTWRNLEAGDCHGTYAVNAICRWVSMTGQGVVWDQQYKQDKENQERTSHMPTNLTPQIINAAIIGFEQEKLRIDTQIAELRSMLDGGPIKPAPAAMPEAPTLKRRKFSAAARRRMREAQQLRWAKIRGASEPPAPTTTEAPKAKRKMSKAGRANIVAALKKRWREKKAAAVKASPAVAKKAAAKKAGKKKAAKAPGQTAPAAQ
jgi:hypothetical protein